MSDDRVLPDREFGVWRAAAASAVGTAHLTDGGECQDAFVCETALGGRALCAAVCDGAGSARRSGTGARIAAGFFVGAAVEMLERDWSGLLEREFAGEIVHGAAAAIEAQAERDGEEIGQYACTLLGVIAHGRRLATFQVGDGAIAIGNAGLWRHVYWPHHGEYANETCFLTDASREGVLRFDVTDLPFDEIGIFSDGLERLLLHEATMTVHAPFFESMMPAVRAATTPGLNAGLSRSLEAYLGSETVNSRTDDDKSLLLATRRPVAGA